MKHEDGRTWAWCFPCAVRAGNTKWKAMLGLHFSVAHKYKEDEYYKISWFPHMPLKFEKRCDLCISLPVDCHKIPVTLRAAAAQAVCHKLTQRIHKSACSQQLSPSPANNCELPFIFLLSLERSHTSQLRRMWGAMLEPPSGKEKKICERKNNCLKTRSRTRR